MALIRNEYCSDCKQATSHVNGSCSPCVIRKQELDRIAEKARWDALTLEEKVEDINRRLKAVESIKGVVARLDAEHARY